MLNRRVNHDGCSLWCYPLCVVVVLEDSDVRWRIDGIVRVNQATEVFDFLAPTNRRWVKRAMRAHHGYVTVKLWLPVPNSVGQLVPFTVNVNEIGVQV